MKIEAFICEEEIIRSGTVEIYALGGQKKKPEPSSAPMNSKPKSRRQLVRRILILTSFLLFPVTLNYFSPAMIIMAAAAGFISGSACIFFAQFLSALFLGRAFCGWMCPGAGEQEACFLAQWKPVARRKCDWVKYLIWVPWISLVFYLWVRNGIRGINFFFMMNSPVSLDEPGRYPIYLTVVGLIFVLSLSVGRRAFCHASCWMAPFMIFGTLIHRRLRIPALHLRAAPDKCTRCHVCTEGCPMSLPVSQLVASGDPFSVECILCGSCVDGCKEKAIRYSFGFTGKAQ